MGTVKSRSEEVNDIPKRTEYHKLIISNSVISEDFSIKNKRTLNLQQMSNSLRNNSEDSASEAITVPTGCSSKTSLSLSKGRDKWHDSFCNELSKDKRMNQMTPPPAAVHSPQACLHINSRLRVEAKCFLME